MLVFNCSKIAEKLFEKDLQSLTTCLTVPWEKFEIVSYPS